ncbi:hypothetical protein CROQUDRAFT_649885 [Cronartium quercuum f. sp. fusiforme G11]|uniref:GPI mannosyltransferase 2 n=1 Tax=Cronartium quercuum f. sp. fusiforme G11 TaxID=708437 RepID=A0A9P6TH52_9BASI|nr:hypothetical protein CROQUDRAFT_649885 [Cronartium quercuum f. sp. fusiforme G11]
MIASLAFVVRLTTLVLLVMLPHSGLVPVFDSSARSMGALEGLVRWDVLHFLSIYRHGGRTVEQQWAFGQGIPWVLFLGRSIIPGKWLTDERAAVLGGSLLAVLASVSSSVLLFFLTIELTASSQFSMLTSLLHVLSPSPSTQVVPYTEPFFAFFTFAGMLGFARLEVHSRQLSKSTVQLCRLSIAGVWAIATCFRPLGILMAGFWAWNWVRRTLDQIWSQPKRRFTALPVSISPSTINLLPSTRKDFYKPAYWYIGYIRWASNRPLESARSRPLS